MLAPETILQGRYRIVGQLGQGGMGSVYEAMDQRLETIVALKETLFADERLRKQFEREARLLAGLHHPALPRVSDHFNEGDGEFLVMQFIAGDDLSAKLDQRRGPFPPDEVLKWADQLLDALDYLHTQDPQIVHRDIKPQNLKLTARGQVVLLDFGLAKGSVGQMSVATSASIFGYTPNYAPLEQVQGLGTDSRSDLYSLAATIYHLLTGMKPPDALSRAASIVNGQPDPLLPASEVARHINPAVAAVLAKGMAQNRDQRYGTADEMRAALNAARESAATVMDREAATVLLGGAGAAAATVGTAPSEQPTALVGERRTAMATERQTAAAETVTRVQSVAPRKGSAVWKGAIAAAILLACAGGFYGYRLIKNREAAVDRSTSAQPVDSNPNANPAPSNEPSVTAAAPKGSETKPPADATVQRIVIGKDPTKQQSARKSNEPPKETPETPAQPDPRTDPRTWRGFPNANVFQTVPPNVPYRKPEDVERLRRAGSVRTLPDGTQVVTQADGTTIVKRPNGATRVYPPGDRPLKRPLRRRLP
jgi:hypothetical protein